MLISLLQDLIRIPSENNGVTGYENDVQLFYHGWLKRHGVNAELIYPETMPGFDTMPGRLPEHEMRNRPLVLASLKGSRPGKRRLLLAHADTVPVGELSAWSDSPFSGKLENGRIYGRGSGDDKWGMALMGCLAVELQRSGCDFPGELIIASVPDEESGGGNGTVAVFASGIKADEAIYLDGGSNQTIWNAGLGGSGCRISGPDHEKIRQVILEVKRNIKKRLDEHPLFGPDFFPLIEKQFFAVCEKEDAVCFFHDTLPGDDEEQIKRDFESRLPDCRIIWKSRFLKPAAVSVDSPLVTGLQDAFRAVTGRDLPTTGGVQSDQGLVETYGGIPCILFGCGRRGLPGSAHLPDEFVETRRLQETYQTIMYWLRNGR